ncbi:defensin-5-like [Choloepus didactylus]|uniref:defensin-5-like n=1 Tax=Choloepus didactylus TaxID=27675 RepID=UPI00189EB3CA|nr:defensin-5-like [Choloepus didactylus]
MRTLALLVAILLLTLPAQGEPLRESADEVPAQEDPEAQDQDVAISFTEDGISTREVSGRSRAAICYCKTGPCDFPEHRSGSCRIAGRRHKLCCR